MQLSHPAEAEEDVNSEPIYYRQGSRILVFVLLSTIQLIAACDNPLSDISALVTTRFERSLRSARHKNLPNWVIYSIPQLIEYPPYCELIEYQSRPRT